MCHSIADMSSDRHRHNHGHSHAQDEAHWAAWAAQTELEGEVLLGFVTAAAQWAIELRGSDAPPARHVIDIGSGPGVGSCELARLLPEATVLAIDSSPAMLERAVDRAAAHGLGARVSTHLAELPGGLDQLARADMIWASMSLHHVGDEVASLRALRDLLEPHGVIAIAELGEPTRMLPDNLDLGRPGLIERLDSAGATWFTHMRDGLPDSVPSTDLPSMVAAAGLTVIGSRLARVRLNAPLDDAGRRVAAGSLRRAREQFDEYLDDDDRHTLDVLVDPDDLRGIMHRPDVFIDSSRQIVVARRDGVPG
jgi:SAM-dependent methyltransferase